MEDCQSLWACALYLILIVQQTSLLQQPVMKSYADCALNVLCNASHDLGHQIDLSEALAYLTHFLLSHLSACTEEQVHLSQDAAVSDMI